MTAAGALAPRRREQQVKWLWTLLEERALARWRTDPAIKPKLKQIETAVAAGELSATLAADQVARLVGV
jgi:LAO/AO transport system kinase